MAPLSVHSPGRGTRTRMPRADGTLLGEHAQARVRGHPAADQDVLDALGSGGVDGLAGEHVADGLLERRGHVGDRDRLAGGLARLHPPGDGGLETGEAEVEAVPLEVAARGEPAREVDRDRRPRARPLGRCRARRGTAGRAAGPPCRRPHPPRRRSSTPAARRTRSRRRRAAATSDRRRRASPGTGRAAAPCSSWSTATWAARWLTPYSGFSSPSASDFAAATPTSSAPARPGPAVTAIASTSRERRRRRSRRPAGSSAPSPRGGRATRPRVRRRRTCACSSTEEATASASRVWPRTMPTPVSSHEVSMPRTSGPSDER